MIYGFLNKILREIISLSVFVCSFIDTFNTVKDVHEINHIRTMEMKSIEEGSSQLWTQFMQLRKKPEKKFRSFNGIWTCNLAIPVRYSNQLSHEATDVGSWSVMCLYAPVKEMNVKDVHEINHIRTAAMKSNESFDFIPQLLIYNIFQIPHRSESKAGNVTDFAMLPA